MKNVLFTTTAIAALGLSSVAFADGHQTTAFNISGSSVVGYNDDIEGGLFLENDVDLKVNHAVGPGYNVEATFGIDMEVSETSGAASNLDENFKFEGASLSTPAGTLSWDDDMDGATAADEFYNDRDGMAVDIPDADGDSGIKWVGTVGDFGYAISTGDSDAAAEGDGDLPTNFTVGAGGSFGDVTVGMGYAQGAGADEDTLGVSADLTLGDFDIGLSFADAANSSIGLTAGATFGDIDAGVYFASNDGADDEYGISLGFGSGPFSVDVEFNSGDGAVDDNFVIAVEYEVNSDVTLYAGMDDSEADDGLWAGAVVGITDNITATISYADFDEAGGPEFKDGTSAYLTIKY